MTGKFVEFRYGRDSYARLGVAMINWIPVNSSYAGSCLVYGWLAHVVKSQLFKCPRS